MNKHDPEASMHASQPVAGKIHLGQSAVISAYGNQPSNALNAQILQEAVFN